jgi:hypothetical protein
MKKQVMPIGLAHQLYNPENYEGDSKPAFGSKKGLAEIGEAFRKVKFC